MSVLISNCYEINKSNTNNSTSKQLWSFPRSRRFDVSSNLTSNILYSDVKNNQSQYRGASIGYGKRYDYFNRNSKNKSDKFYNYKTDFDISSGNNASGSPSYSFGRKIYNIDKIYDKNVKTNIDPLQPGPGSYKIKDDNNKPKYSFGGRNLIYSKKGNFPGSGAYNHDPMKYTGKYILSKNPNINQASFGSSKSPRFRSIIQKIDTPGPGSFEISGANCKHCKLGNRLPNIHNHSGFRNDFSETSKKILLLLFFISLAPGPGQYRAPSEFGYYVSKHFVK